MVKVRFFAGLLAFFMAMFALSVEKNNQIF